MDPINQNVPESKAATQTEPVFSPQPAPQNVAPVQATTSEPVYNQAPFTTPPQGPTPVKNDATHSSSKKGKLAVVAVAIAAVLMASSAAAYYAVVVPSKPENILKTALFKTFDQKSASFAGTFNFKQGDTASKVTFKGKGDIAKQVSQLEADITVTGVKVPVEIRSVQKNIYMKFGDLGSVKGLAALADPTLKTYVDEIALKLSNQWIEVDSTLTDQAGLGCYYDLKSTLTEEDKELLTKLYASNAFAKIKNTTDDVVNGKAAIKYELEIDDNKGAEYVKGLDQLSVVKKLKDCSKDESTEFNTKELADNDITPLTIWVDKESKLITKLASQSTEQDKKKENIQGDIELTINYEAVDVSMPESSKPLMEVFGDFAPLLQQGFGGNQGLESFEDVLGAMDIRTE